MKKVFFLCVCLQFIVMQSFAQNDTAYIRVCYKETLNFSQTTKYDNFELLIGEKFSKFYSLENERSQKEIDSVNNATKGNPTFIFNYLAKSKNTNTIGQTYQVFKHFPTDSVLTYTTTYLLGPEFVYKYEEPIAFKWSLCEKTDTIIAGYRCYKATTNHRGRNWIAWYAPEITVDDGPWKLCGLPGLILQAQTSDGVFCFACKEFNPNVNVCFSFAKKKYKRIEPNELNRLLSLEPAEYLHEVKGFELPHGKKNKPKKKTFMEIF